MLAVPLAPVRTDGGRCAGGGGRGDTAPLALALVGLKTLPREARCGGGGGGGTLEPALAPAPALGGGKKDAAPLALLAAALVLAAALFEGET